MKITKTQLIWKAITHNLMVYFIITPMQAWMHIKEPIRAKIYLLLGGKDKGDYHLTELRKSMKRDIDDPFGISNCLALTEYVKLFGWSEEEAMPFSSTFHPAFRLNARFDTPSLEMLAIQSQKAPFGKIVIDVAEHFDLVEPNRALRVLGDDTYNALRRAQTTKEFREIVKRIQKPQ